MSEFQFNLNIFIPYDLDSIDQTLKRCEAAVNDITPNADIRFKLIFAIHELVINSLEHGYQQSSGEVSISISKDKDLITLEIADHGKGMESSDLKEDYTLTRIEDATARGWGLFIIHEIFSSLKISQNTPFGTKTSVTIANA